MRILPNVNILNFRAANFVSESFMSYCAKLQLKVRDPEKSLTLSPKCSSPASKFENISTVKERFPCVKNYEKYKVDRKDDAQETVENSRISPAIQEEVIAIPEKTGPSDELNECSDSDGPDNDGNIMF